MFVLLCLVATFALCATGPTALDIMPASKKATPVINPSQDAASMVACQKSASTRIHALCRHLDMASTISARGGSFARALSQSNGAVLTRGRHCVQKKSPAKKAAPKPVIKKSPAKVRLHAAAALHVCRQRSLRCTALFCLAARREGMRECFQGHLSLAAAGQLSGPHQTAAKCTVNDRTHTHTHSHSLPLSLSHQSPAKAAAKSPAKKAAPAKKATPVKKPKPVVIMDKKPKVPTSAARPDSQPLTPVLDARFQRLLSWTRNPGFRVEGFPFSLFAL